MPWSSALAQPNPNNGTLKGVVKEWDNDEPMIGANIHIYQNEAFINGAPTDENGFFSLSLPPGDYMLHCSFAGSETYYERIKLVQSQVKSLTITLSPKSISACGPPTIYGNRDRRMDNQAKLVRIYSNSTLLKGSGSSFLETLRGIPGVQAAPTCGVCGTAELRLGGLAGPYTQLLINDVPVVGGLGAIYGLAGIPSGFIRSLTVERGPSEPAYSTAGIAGTIRLDFLSPSQLADNPSELRLETSSSGEAVAEAFGGFRIGKVGNPKANAIGWAVHGGGQYLRLDGLKDNYLDAPLSGRASGLLMYEKKVGKLLNAHVRVYSERRLGGELNANWKDRTGTQLYTEAIDTRRLETGARYQLTQKWRLLAAGSLHNQRSWYGAANYNATEATGILNLMRGDVVQLGNRLRAFVTYGPSLRWAKYSDNTGITGASYNWLLPAAVVKVDFTKQNKSSGYGPGDVLVVYKPLMPIGFSARIEQHPVHGLLVMPQLGGRTEIAKWNLGASVGRGLRTVNLATEDHAFLSGTRQVVVPAGLPPERAWSGGLGVGRLWILEILGKSNRATFQFDADLFGTRFQTRIAADLGEIGVVNYVIAPGAYAYGTTIAGGLTFNNGLEIQGNVTVQRSQFGENDANGKLVYQNEFYLPRAMGTATVELPGRIFGKNSRFAQALKFNLNARATGAQRMPAQPFDATVVGPRPEYSPSYVEVDALATFVTQTYIKLSLGVRNLLNYRQVTPIVGGGDPFGAGFDPNYVYGPLVGRRVVVGVQVPIGKSK